MMDTLTSLRVFVAVADLKSFAAAAERFDLSPAMTSKHIQHLERRAGARLLNRTSRSVSLTEAGVLYLDRVRGLLDGLEDVEARIGAAAIAPRGVLKISLPVWMANPRFARMIAAYQATFPEVTLDLDLEGRVVNLVEEGFDLALRGTATPDEGLIARKLAQAPFHLVAAPALLDRLGRPKQLKELDGLPLLAYSPVIGDGRILIGQGEGAYEVRFSPVLRSRNETILLLAAKEGMGLAFMPKPMVEDDISDGRLERVLPKKISFAAPLFAVYPNRSYLPAKVRTFLDFLIKSGDLGWTADEWNDSRTLVDRGKPGPTRRRRDA
jgi:DNA-binding transcriptional LysR family regulator